MSRGIRKGQIIGVHGPGAIADIGDESFAVTSIEQWRHAGMCPCDLPRLSRRLGVLSLRQPKTGESRFSGGTPSVALHRFPQWMFCQNCRRMVLWNRTREQSLGQDQVPSCQNCQRRPPLVPMRFVQICENGHLDDINWLWWVHGAPGGSHQCHNREKLEYSSRTGAGSGLGSLQIKCLDCGTKRNLGELHSQGNWRCRAANAHHGGRQPWQRRDSGTPCDCDARVVQRGDSNVHFSRVVSALDIPVVTGTGQSDAKEDTIKGLQEFRDLKDQWEDLKSNGLDVQTLLDVLVQNKCNAWEIDKSRLIELLDGVDEQVEQIARPSLGDHIREMKAEEFVALARPDDVQCEPFSGRSYNVDAASFGSSFAQLIESVSLIEKLREVRAFCGFHRVRPAGEEQFVTASLDSTVDWLPACEVFGEGIFLRFRTEAIKAWENGLPRAENIRLRALQLRIVDQNLGFLPEVSARLIAIHGLAHLLIRQLCFESGYASSSLRERMYVDEDMAGLLIYTADGDSEGTMGGLVRQGYADKLPAVLGRALAAAAWCSGDPLCSEGENQGMAGLNRAACHACVLVSETSCECANALLDRRFLIGDSGSMTGLFSDALVEMGVA